MDPEAAARAERSKKFAPAMPLVKVNFQYKPMATITDVDHYIKFIPSVYERNNLFFDWHETLYELNSNDRRFLVSLNNLIQ